MRKSFCTLFDSGYLTRGLALYRSLEAHLGAEFEIAITCFDDRAYDLLTRLALPRARLVRLSEFETPELLAVKPTRSRGEYCWTCTSWTIIDAQRRFGWDEVTYLDADLFFFSSPEALLREWDESGGSALITEHRYHPDYDQSATSGIYCVQFMGFRADERGRAILRWWGERCLEWCYARHEDGKFGDQKYLDDWTTRFPGVHVLRHLGGGVAPWNLRRYRVGPGPVVDGVPVVFVHFHSLRWRGDGVVDLAGPPYQLPPGAREEIYAPYVRALAAAWDEVRALEPGFTGGHAAAAPGFGARVKRAVKWVLGRGVPTLRV